MFLRWIGIYYIGKIPNKIWMHYVVATTCNESGCSNILKVISLVPIDTYLKVIFLQVF